MPSGCLSNRFPTTAEANKYLATTVRLGMDLLPSRPPLPLPRPINGTFFQISVTDEWCNWTSRLFDAAGNPTKVGPPPEEDPILIVQLIKLYLLIKDAVDNHTRLPVSLARLKIVGRNAYTLPDTELRLEQRPAIFTAVDGEIVTCYLPNLLTDDMQVPRKMSNLNRPYNC